jgi:hypothetical protein
MRDKHGERGARRDEAGRRIARNHPAISVLHYGVTGGHHQIVAARRGATARLHDGSRDEIVHFYARTPRGYQAVESIIARFDRGNQLTGVALPDGSVLQGQAAQDRWQQALAAVDQ